MGERRAAGMAGVLFTDLVGSTDLMARVGEDAFDELRRDHFTRLRGAVAQSGGREIKTLGDGILVVFDSATDAVACAVTMQQVVDLQARMSKAPIAIRAGLAVGEVSFEESDVFGRPVVEAARLVSQAEGGQILATHAVRLVAGSRPGISFRELGELRLKGLPDAVVAFDVGWEPLPGSAVPLPALLTDVGPIFVGRDAEFAELRRAWDETAREGLRVMLLAGEPGVGKTRMAAELAAQVYAEGATVLAGRCDEDLGVPFQLFVEPLRQFVDHTPDDELPERLGRYGGELVRLVPELAQRVPGLPPPLSADPESERYRVFEGVASWLGSVSSDRPLLLVLDDLHWAAKPNLLLLRHVLRSVGLGRLMVVGTYRDTELTHGHPLIELVADLRRGTTMGRLLLDGLSEEGVATYLSEAAGGQLDENGRAVARAIHAETQGNPFFVREVLRHLVETGAFNRREGRWTSQPVEALGIPEGVREVVGRRLTRLSETCNRVLRAAAVIGMEFELPVLEAASDLDEEQAVAALDEAVTARLVTETSGQALRYRFAHSLMRETVYRDLTTARRVTLHRRVAEALEKVYAGRLDDHLPALAHHYARAAAPVGGAVKAVGFARQAGDRALMQLAHHDAAAFYQQALDLVEISDGDHDVSERLDLLIRLGEAQRRAGDPAHRDTLIRACKLARDEGDAEALARAALANFRGMFAIIGAVDEERAAMLEAALEAQGPAETTVRARLLANLAVEMVYGKDRDRRYVLSAEALAMARRLGEPETLAHALLARIVAVWGPDSVVERLALTEELVALATSLEDAVLVCSGCWHRFVAAAEAGDDPEADRCLERSEQLSSELGQPTMRWLTMILRACRELTKGRIAESEKIAGQGYALGEAAGHPDVFLYYGIHLFNVRFERGNLEEIAGDVVRIAAANPGVASVRASLALLHAETDQLDQARPVFEALVDQLGEIPREASWPRAVAQAALTCARLRDRARAEVLLEFLAPYREQMICTGLTWYGSVAHFVGVLEAVLGRLDGADANLAHAESAHGRVPAPTWLARTRLERGKILLARRAPGDVQRARDLLAQARATAEEYGLTRVERAAAGLLAEMGSPAHRA
ncbi:MAG TPA: AAA family ATPase [Acidimicrobiales bacterium]|nr:AAA family ATPase [Acidimicrobiales bacterium]